MRLVFGHNRPMPSPFPVYVGFDSREAIAYDVCAHSILTRTRTPVTVQPLKLDELRRRGVYTRAHDPLQSTEFTYTRFFVPYLADYAGWALFCDCDFRWLADIKGLIDLADDRYALMCVHHDHRPPEHLKMDGRQQTVYPRKNWSSLVLYNCGHPANRVLTPELINRESGSFLHRFQWLDDALIGAVPESWNWLEGWSAPPDTGHPNVVHYTRGGPWFPQWRTVQFADLWLTEAAEFAAVGSQREPTARASG